MAFVEATAVLITLLVETLVVISLLLETLVVITLVVFPRDRRTCGYLAKARRPSYIPLEMGVNQYVHNVLPTSPVASILQRDGVRRNRLLHGIQHGLQRPEPHSFRR